MNLSGVNSSAAAHALANHRTVAASAGPAFNAFGADSLDHGIRVPQSTDYKPLVPPSDQDLHAAVGLGLSAVS